MAADRLTPMEEAVLQVLAEGETPKGCQRRLDISRSTVYTHIANAKIRAGLHSQAPLHAVVLWYIQDYRTEAG